jgi:hypothetical protein
MFSVSPSCNASSASANAAKELSPMTNRSEAKTGSGRTVPTAAIGSLRGT